MTSRGGGLCGAVEEDDQLKLLFVERVHGHVEEGATFVDDVVERERTHKEEVVLPGVHREVDAHLVHDDRLPFGRVRCPQQLAIDLASYHEGLAQVSHSDRQGEETIFGADNGHVTERDALCPLLGQRDFAQDDSAQEAIENGSKEVLNDENGHGTRAVRGKRSTTIPDGCLGFKGVKESCGESIHISDTWHVLGWRLLPRQVSVAVPNPVPQ